MGKLEYTFQVEFNPDFKKAMQIKQLVKDNNGYCPNCSIKEKDTKCMCKKFREQQYEGLCPCGLYYKRKVVKKRG